MAKIYGVSPNTVRHSSSRLWEPAGLAPLLAAVKEKLIDQELHGEVTDKTVQAHAEVGQHVQPAAVIDW